MGKEQLGGMQGVSVTRWCGDRASKWLKGGGLERPGSVEEVKSEQKVQGMGKE